MTPNLIKIEQLVRSKKAINTNNKLIKRMLGFEDMRDFIDKIQTWGYSRDFTYQAHTDDWQKFFKLFLKENYLD